MNFFTASEDKKRFFCTRLKLINFSNFEKKIKIFENLKIPYLPQFWDFPELQPQKKSKADQFGISLTSMTRQIMTF